MSSQSLPLQQPAEVPDELGPPHDLPSRSPIAPLWTIIHAPHITVDALALSGSSPAIVIDADDPRQAVFATNEAARQLGIARGQTLASAKAICDRIIVRQRNTDAEQSLLKAAARAGYQVSDYVCLYSTDAVALETARSMRLFKGMSGIESAISIHMKKLDVHYRIQSAPTPRAAYWLAHSGNPVPELALTDLRGALRSFPIHFLTDNQAILKKFLNCGIRTLGDALKLPDKDATRRFGPKWRILLNQALGLEPEPLARYYPAEPFECGLEFSASTMDVESVKTAGDQLLQQLESHLQSVDGVVDRVEFLLIQEEGFSVTVPIGCRRPVRQLSTLSSLMHEHFNRLSISRPALALRLKTQNILPATAVTLDLFGDTSAENNEWCDLLDQLEARIGTQGLVFPGATADHRPEYAIYPAQYNQVQDIPGQPRPVWLLNKPQPINSADLHIISDCERIEQGWFDRDVRRDYYRARTESGALCWIFRDIHKDRWYLHGWFG